MRENRVTGTERVIEPRLLCLKGIIPVRSNIRDMFFFDEIGEGMRFNRFLGLKEGGQEEAGWGRVELSNMNKIISFGNPTGMMCVK